MRKVVVCALLVLGLTGCGDTGKPGDGGEGDNGNNPMKDITNRKNCKGAPEAGSTLFTTWNQTFTQNETFYFYRFEFTGNSLRFTNTCSYKDGRSLSPSIVVPIHVDGTLITVLAARQSELKDRDHQCFANIPKIEMNFSLLGPCLALQVQGQTHYLVK